MLGMLFTVFMAIYLILHSAERAKNQKKKKRETKNPWYNRKERIEEDVN